MGMMCGKVLRKAHLSASSVAEPPVVFVNLLIFAGRTLIYGFLLANGATTLKRVSCWLPKLILSFPLGWGEVDVCPERGAPVRLQITALSAMIAGGVDTLTALLPPTKSYVLSINSALRCP